MTTITLPPLPSLDFEEYSDDTTFSCEAGYSPETLRAYSLEVARVVLEGAANWIRTQRMVTPANGFEFASSILALEVKHHE